MYIKNKADIKSLVWSVCTQHFILSTLPALSSALHFIYFAVNKSIYNFLNKQIKCKIIKKYYYIHMKLIELILDDNDAIGVEAISVVENPAIESDFIALNSQDIKLAEINKEKRLLMGALLIPNKPIYRKNGLDEYHIFFSKETITKASQMYLQNGNQSNSTLEHDAQLKGLTLVESWIVEDKAKDKTALYGLDVPVGTWMGSVKVDNDEIWNDYVKSGKVKGFSIEGYFADKIEAKKQEEITPKQKLIMDLIDLLMQEDESSIL